MCTSGPQLEPNLRVTIDIGQLNNRPNTIQIQVLSDANGAIVMS